MSGEEIFDASNSRNRCGIGPCKPKWLQKLADIRVYVLSYALAAMLSSSLGIYIVSQVTTLEKVLGLSSKKMGVLMSANDIGYLLVIMFASHIGRNANRPFVIGVLAAVFGFMAFFCAVPHFIMSSYEGLFYYSSTSEESETPIMSKTFESSLCSVNSSTTDREDTTVDDDIKSTIRSISFAIMFISLFVQGMVKAPRYPLSITYIDDHTPKTKVGLYIGISTGIVIFGLLIATGISAKLSQIYATMKPVAISNRDARWIGAWWLGFITIGFGAILMGIPLLCFPKFLKTHKKYRNLKEEEAAFLKTKKSKSEKKYKKKNSLSHFESNTPQFSEDGNLKQEIADFPKALLRLVKNAAFMCILVSNGIGVLGFMGRFFFFPKYLEVHFNMMRYQASLFFGLTIMVGAGFGSFLSGSIMWIFKMSPRTSLIFSVILTLITSGLGFVGLGLKCPQLQYEGFDINRLTDSQLSRNRSFVSNNALDNYGNSACSQSCSCSDNDYFPICGEDGKTYFSPCHAGCFEKTVSERGQLFSNCSCLPDSTNQTAVSGTCAGTCSQAINYLILSFIWPIISMIAVMPKVIVKLRCVAEKDRSLSVGVNSFIGTLLGSFLSPIFYGAVIDTTCILWKSGNCRIYDVADLRFKLHVTSGSIELLADVIYACAMFIILFDKGYVEFHKKKEYNDDSIDKQLADVEDEHL